MAEHFLRGLLVLLVVGLMLGFVAIGLMILILTILNFAGSIFWALGGG